MKNTVVDLQLTIQIIHEDDVSLSNDEITSFLNEQLQGVPGWDGLINTNNIIQVQTLDVETKEEIN